MGVGGRHPKKRRRCDGPTGKEGQKGEECGYGVKKGQLDNPSWERCTTEYTSYEHVRGSSCVFTDVSV